MKLKLLYLSAAFALLGSFAIGGALSFPPVTDTDTSDEVDVCDPEDLGSGGPEVDLVQFAAEIAADNAYHKVDDIKVGEEDDCYTYTLIDREIIDNGTDNDGVGGADCGTHDYSLDGGGDLNSDSDDVGVAGELPPDQDVDDLFLKISPVDTNELCAVSGGEVEATFSIP